MAPHWPFVGRRDEVDAVATACGNGGRGIVLAGPSGVGKTRIAEGAMQRLRQRGCDVRIVMATRSTSSIPFGAFGAYSDASRSFGDPVEAVSAILGAAAPGKSVCLVDDAHLLDQRSAMLLRRHVVDGTAKVVLTVRSGEPAPDDITALWRDGQLTRRDVGPLSDAELLASAETALGGVLDSSAAARLTTLSGGNAMYFRQLVEGQRAAGQLVRIGDVWRWEGPVRIPPGLAELVRARLAGIPEVARDVLDFVALAEPLELEALVELTSRVAAEHAERNGVIVIDDANGTLVARAAHPLFAEIAAAELPRLRARRLRGRLVHALERRPAKALGQPPSEEPVMTLRRAVLLLDADTAVDPELLARGASAAIASGDASLADRLAGASLAVGGGFVAQNVRAFVRSWAARDPAAADRELSRLAGLAQTPDEAVRAVLNRTMHLAWGSPDPDAGMAVLAAGRDEWPDAPVLIACEALINVYRATGDATAVAGLVDGTSEAEVTGLAATAVAAHAAATGQFDTFVAATSRGIAMADSGEPVSFGVSVTPMVVRGFCLAGELDQGRRIAGERYRAALGKEPFVQAAACMAADVELAAGSIRSALRLYNEAWAGFPPDSDLGPWRSICAVGLSRATALLGDVDAARSWSALAEASRRPGFALLDVDLSLARAVVTAAEGSTTEAISVALAAADLARDRSHSAYELLALQQALQLGATGLADRVQGVASGIRGPRVELVRMLASAEERGDGAALRAASAGFERMGDLLAAGDAAAMACVAFERSRAGVATQEARIRVRRLIAATDGARTVRMARCVAALPLTGREWEIAGLAANGVSTREIAVRLVLSARTVEGHLYRIYQKLGLENRGELSAALKPVIE